MEILLKVVGAIWALIGFGNMVAMPWLGGSTGVLTFGLLFNMVLFVIPGLIVYGIGALVRNRSVASVEESTVEPSEMNSESSVEERLNQLSSLKDKCLIDEAEYINRRAEILKEV